MRIYGTNGAPAAVPGAMTRRPGSGAFSVAAEEGTAAPSAAATLRTVGGIDALMALQGIDDPAERRRRSIRRGRGALDVLDELKLGLLAGSLDPSTLGRLKAAAEGLRDLSGDGNLDAVLAEIELRVAVELAKLTPRA